MPNKPIKKSLQISPRANKALSEAIGELNKVSTKDFWTFGHFSLIDLILYVLNQSGTAKLSVISWSISEEVAKTFYQLQANGATSETKFLLDYRIKTRKAAALQIILNNFEHRKIKVHGKLTLIENEDFKITILGSLNLTRNPNLEFGILSTCPHRFDYHKKNFNETFNSGRT